jgi:hypothetical protein
MAQCSMPSRERPKVVLAETTANISGKILVKDEISAMGTETKNVNDQFLYKFKKNVCSNLLPEKAL